MTADEAAGRPRNLEGPLVGVCSTLGKSLSPNLLVLLLTKVDGALLVEEGTRDALDGGMSSNSSGGADAFG